MSTLRVIVLSFVATCIAGVLATPASANKVTLRWKLQKGQTIAYQTNLEPFTKQQYLSIPTRKLAEGATLSPSHQKQLFQTKIASHFSMVTLLKAETPKRISVKVIQTGVQHMTGPTKYVKRMRKLMKKMNGTVQLRGHITPSGRLLSFYLQNRQKNLFGMMFELPSKAVKVGERWPLQVSLLSMGGNFIPISAHRTNHATLLSLRKAKGGEQIATILYQIAETFHANHPAQFGGKAQELRWDIGFYGIGEFLVKQGRWKRYAGRMLLSTKGMMNRNTQSRFELFPMTRIPPKLMTIK